MSDATAIGPEVAVILPAYNEAQTVCDTVLGFHAALPGARIFVVDNNSSDGTGDLARALFAERGIPGGVLFEPRRGKGNAVRRAFLEIEARAYLMADADCTYPPAQARELLAPILANEADVIVGDRRSQGDYSRENTRPLHDFGNKLVQRLVNMVGGSEYVDIMSGYRAMSRAYVRSYPLLVDGFQLETDMALFAAQGRFRCREIPVRYVNRPAGSVSKLNTLRDGMRVLMTIFTILRFYKPLLFFSLCSLVMALAGLLLGLPVINEFMETHYVSKVPTAILASSLEVLAMVLFSVGLNLDALAHQRAIELEKTIRQNTSPRSSC